MKFLWRQKIEMKQYNISLKQRSQQLRRKIKNVHSTQTVLFADDTNILMCGSNCDTPKGYRYYNVKYKYMAYGK